jgi:hypothetical protein
MLREIVRVEIQAAAIVAENPLHNLARPRVSA